MGQFRALMYKNIKLQSKSPCSSIFQVILPVVCILIIYSLQQLAGVLSDLTEDVIPANLPFNSIAPLNLPVQLGSDFFDSGDESSCYKINKYGFSDTNDAASKKFVQDSLMFNNQKHLRNLVCKQNKTNPLMSPYFNLTDANTYDDLNKDMKAEMDLVYQANLVNLKNTTIPFDGYYLFHKANRNGINATLLSNNMNNQLYHRPNSQTEILAKGIPVS